ncbi:FHA domain protein [uncultured archaeon]|nr:FHA domain protein [uncultured archaeon]
MKIYLVDLIRENPEKVIEIPEVGNVTVGRGKSADLVIGAEEETIDQDSDYADRFLSYVSRNHCTIYVDSSQPYVVDNGSKNGTYVNGERVESSLGTIIENGDILSLGSYGFQVFHTDKNSRDPDLVDKISSILETVPYEPKPLNNSKGNQ